MLISLKLKSTIKPFLTTFLSSVCLSSHHIRSLTAVRADSKSARFGLRSEHHVLLLIRRATEHEFSLIAIADFCGEDYL